MAEMWFKVGVLVSARKEVFKVRVSLWDEGLLIADSRAFMYICLVS